MTTVTLCFLFFLLAFTVVGVLSYRKSRKNSEDYLLAGRSVPAWLVALSAVATMNSGFMFVGQIGLTYRVGLHSLWWLVGWAIGDLIAWVVFYGRLRRLSEEENAISPLGLLDPGNRREPSLVLPLVGIAVVLFMATYASAQLKAGSTALESLFGWPPWIGAVIGAVIVVLYCLAGGLRASIWTDAAQSIVMIVTMFLLLVFVSSNVGGPADLADALKAQDPALTNLFPQDLQFGFFLWFIGLVFGGFGVIGQPHIIVRSMSLKDPDKIARARRYYFAWLIPFYSMAIGVGLYARVLLPELGPEASERALPELGLLLMPDVLVGLMLAALFAATMSTADSLIIACTTTITQDVVPRWRRSVLASKASTLAITLLGLLVAIFAGKGVFTLVLIAWSGPACTVGPVLILRLLGRDVPQPTALAMITAGLLAVIAWYNSPFDDAIFRILPGMVAAFAVYGLDLGIRRGLGAPAATREITK